MANNKGKNTSVVKPRRLGVGTVLSCLQSLRRRQSKAPQVLERSLATTVRRGSGRRTVPLDVEVEMASTSAVGGGEIKEVTTGEVAAEINPAANRSMDERPALTKQEMEHTTPPITQDLGSESISLYNTPSLYVTEEKTEDLGSTNISTDDQHLINRYLDESPAFPKQEMEQITPPITQNLGSESISVSNTPSLCVTQEKAEDVGSASTVAEDQHLANRDAPKSLDQSSATSKQEMVQDTQDLSSKSMAELEEEPTSSNLSAFDVSPLLSQLHTENTNENTMVENTSIISGNQPINGDNVLKSMDQSLKQEMGHMQDSSGKNMAKLEYDPTMETPTSSNANDFDASPALPLPSPPSIPLLPSLLSNENTDQNTEEMAVNTTMGNSSLVSNSSDHQLTSGKHPEQSSDSWKLTMDLETLTTQRDKSRIKNPFSFLDSKLFRSTSTPSRPLPHLPTIPYPSFFPTQSDDQLLAGNTERKAVDMPALPLKPEPTSNIGEEGKALMNLNVSTKEEADRRLSSEVPLNILHMSSPSGYLLLVPIGMAIIFLALLSIWAILLFFLTFGAAVLILFAVGVFALSAFAVFAVAGTAVVSVWAGTLWAMWVGARTGLVVTKFFIAVVSSAARAFMAVDV